MVRTWVSGGCALTDTYPAWFCPFLSISCLDLQETRRRATAEQKTQAYEHQLQELTEDFKYNLDTAIFDVSYRSGPA